MIPRILEPEVMDTAAEASDYDAMDHAGVNRQFVDDLLMAWNHAAAADHDIHLQVRSALRPSGGPLLVLDVGTGTARIPLELVSRNLSVEITGIDLAEEMLSIGRRNVAGAGVTNIRLQHVDAKLLPFAAASFDVVMSNSIIHHIPEPKGTFAEMRRVLRPGGLLFVRDLFRPDSSEAVERLVQAYAGNESRRQQQLLRQSFHAALTIDELGPMLGAVGIDVAGLSPSSDRHWTLIWQKPPLD